MYNISLRNGKSFLCDSNTTIFEAARNNGIILEHSCLTGRCRSCIVQLLNGSFKEKSESFILNSQEKLNSLILTCNSIPTSDIVLDIEDLSGILLYEKKIVPAKLHSKKNLNQSVIEVVLRLPPNSGFKYNSGQYVNISRGDLRRSYSIANAYNESNYLTFYIKMYEDGLMSKYWFFDSKENDLLRIEGPLGSFFLRESDKENIIFLATGTGIAPIQAILEDILGTEERYKNKRFWVFLGARCENDIFWNFKQFETLTNLIFIPVLSRPVNKWDGAKGYVQDVLLKQNINLNNSQVYACGFNDMIKAAQEKLIENGLNKCDFFSDAFVATN